ncbi:MAG: hypothetical protein ACREUW_01435 [Burkholderiales bacterium]
MSTHRSLIALSLVVTAAVGGCGVETAGTAATAAAVKQQELVAGKKTMEQMQRKIDDAQQKAEETQQQAEKAADR